MMVSANNVLRQLLADDPVVITGMGSVCCAGLGVPALWEAVRNGRAGGKWQTFSSEDRTRRFPVAAVAEVPAHQLTGKVDRSVSLAIAAALEAWTQAAVCDVPAEEISVVAGTSRGPHRCAVLERDVSVAADGADRLPGLDAAQRAIEERTLTRRRG